MEDIVCKRAKKCVEKGAFSACCGFQHVVLLVLRPADSFAAAFFITFASNYHLSPMSIIKIKDKTFRTFIPEQEIQQRVKAVAEKINKDMDGKNPLLLAVLNGSFIFAADLMR